MVHRPIVFVDVETTGLSAANGHVVEIGAVRIENHAVVASMNQLINPGVHIPSYITRITGITDADIASSPQFREVADSFEQLMDGAIFAAHNVNFDYSFLQSEFKRAGQKFGVDRFCTAKLSRTLQPQHRRHSLDAIIERGGYKVANRHRAYDDAMVLFKFYSDTLAEHGLDIFKTIERLLIKTSAKPKDPPLQYVPFFE